MIGRVLLGAEADDLDRVAHLDLAALDPAGADGAAALDREDVLDGHQERLVDLADRLGDVLVHRLDQVEDRLGGLGIARVLQGRAAAAADDRDLVAGELVVGQQLAELQLDQLEQLLVVDQVDLVEEDDQGRDADLAGQQDVLAGLGHRAVGRRDDQDGAVHLGRAGDHVLDVVGVARAVDVGVVPLVALVLDVRDGDGHGLGRVADGPALGDVGVRLRLGPAVLGQDRQDGGRQRRLAVVDVPDRAHVDVRLGSGEGFLCHVLRLSLALLCSTPFGITDVTGREHAQPPHTPTVVRSRTGLPAVRGWDRWVRLLIAPMSGSNPKPESCRWDLNPGPRPYQGRALPTEPRQQLSVLSSPRLRPLRRVRLVATPVSAIDRRRSILGDIPVQPDLRPRRAGDGNRTHVACLEGRYSTIELHPRLVSIRSTLSSVPGSPSPGANSAARARFLIAPPTSGPRSRSVPCPSGATWVEQDSNLRRHCHQIYSLAPLAAWVSTRISIASYRSRCQLHCGLQSVERIRPIPRRDGLRRGRAGGETRTHNPRFTKPMLCRLSYASNLIPDVSILLVSSWYRDREDSAEP